MKYDFDSLSCISIYFEQINEWRNRLIQRIQQIINDQNNRQNRK